MLIERIGRNGVLLIFDSLTSPYLFSGSEILRFMTQPLSRFAARGNAFLAGIDEGCGKQEDLVAMMRKGNRTIVHCILNARTTADLDIERVRL